MEAPIVDDWKYGFAWTVARCDSHEIVPADGWSSDGEVSIVEELVCGGVVFKNGSVFLDDDFLLFS